MKDQHTKISGYRELSQEEIDLMNRIKAFGPDLEKLCEDLFEYHENQLAQAEMNRDLGIEYKRIMDASPTWWRNEGRMHLQQGLMFLTRSVAQPTFF
jgi:hypothetical protein